MSKVRIGFVGVGGMGQMAHLRNYVTNSRLRGRRAGGDPASRPPSSSPPATASPRSIRDHQEMLAAEQLDGIVASQPFDRHAVLLPEIYGKVKHVFTEKPLAVSVAAGQTLARLPATAARSTWSATTSAPTRLSSMPGASSTSGRRPARWARSSTSASLMPAGDWIAAGFTGLLNAGDKAGDLPSEPADR